MSSSQCPNCGAAVTLPSGVISGACVFCESPLVAGQAQGEQPDLVAPFVLGKDAAAQRLSSFLQGQWLAPASVRASRNPNKLRGVLVPFWAYDAAARSRWDGNIGVYWYRTETYTVTVTRDGKTVTETRTRQVRETEWFPTHGTHAASYTGHLVSGSQGLPEGEANALEPFDLGSALPYSPALLAGWVAESPTIAGAQAESVAQTELGQAEQRAVMRFLPGNTARGVQVQSDIAVTGVRLALLPVWIATYSWGGDVQRLLVNGQTGEVVGSVPKAWFKVAALVVAGLFAALIAVVFILAVVGLAQ